MYEDMKMALRERLEELMVNIALQIYRYYVINDKGRLLLYVTLKKALYSFMILSLLFCEQLVEDMIGKGFELNPYKPCVVNKMIVGKKMAV